MQALTGGLEKTGTGAEKTVKGAHVLVSTVDMKRSIADLYAVRKDFYDANKAVIEKFTAGYLKACDELLRFKARSRKDKTAQARYRAILKLAQEVYGKQLPTQADANRLITDAVFVGLPGNRAFFKDVGNPSGFAAKQKHALELTFNSKKARQRATFVSIDLDYKEIAKSAGLPVALVDQPPLQWSRKPKLGKPIFSFAIRYSPEQKDPVSEHAADLKRAVELVSLFSNATLVIRGHADPASVLEAALAKKILTRKGKPGEYSYHLKDGKKIDLDDPKSMKAVVDIIRKEDFKGGGDDPKKALAQAEKQAQEQAEAISRALVKYAAREKLRLDRERIDAVGAGILHPVIPWPKNNSEAAKNRRVEFRLYKIRGGPPVPVATDNPSYDY